MLLPFQDVSLAILVPVSESGGLISIISGVIVPLGGLYYNNEQQLTELTGAASEVIRFKIVF